MRTDFLFNLLFLSLLSSAAPSPPVPVSSPIPPRPVGGYPFSLRLTYPSKILFSSYLEAPPPTDRVRLGFPTTPRNTWLPINFIFYPASSSGLGSLSVSSSTPRAGTPDFNDRLYLRRTFSNSLPAYLTRVGNPSEDPDPADAANLAEYFAIMHEDDPRQPQQGKGKFYLGYRIGPELGIENDRKVYTEWTACMVVDWWNGTGQPLPEGGYEVYFGRRQKTSEKRCYREARIEVVFNEPWVWPTK